MIQDRYAIVLHGGDSAAADRQLFTAAPAMMRCATGQRFSVFVEDARAWTDFGAAGGVVGGLFARKAGQSNSELAAGARGTDGELLLQSAWGDYLAIFEDPVREEFSALRSPSGGLHAYVARHGPWAMISNDAALLIRCGAARDLVDWGFVAAHLAYPHLRGSRTGLSDVAELFPGERVILTRFTQRRSSCWVPWPFLGRRSHDGDAAAAHLRDTIVACTQRLAERYASIVLELSGGLDSSIVAAALSGSDARVEAINLVTPTGEGDERRYARAAARCFDYHLVEARPDDNVDLTCLPLSREPRPGFPGVLRAWERRYIERAREVAAEAFFGGTGGDNVFCSLGTTAPVIDALRSEGLRSAWRALRDVVDVHDTNWFTAMRLTVRQLRRSRHAAPWPAPPEFLGDASRSVERPWHPWLDEPPDLLPGQRSHVRSVMAAQAHLDGYDRHLVAPSVFPLLAQPVLECCFSIPTWQWVDRGQDRAIARDAFRAMLPRENVDRRTKGMMNLYCAQLFQAARPQLRDFLLDGQLAAHGMIDRPALATYLASDDPVDDIDFYRVLTLADVEAWVQSRLDG